MDWKEHYSKHLCTASEAVRGGITEGVNTIIGHAAAAPDAILEAINQEIEHLPHFSMFHVLYFGKGHHLDPKVLEKMRLKVNFMEARTRKLCNEGLAEHLPCHFHEVPRLIKDGDIPCDVAIVQLSRPNAEGYCSYGLSCDYTKAAADKAKVVIAEVNEQMPFIGGDNLIHVSQLDYIVEVNYALPEVPPAQIGEKEQVIGKLCASLIEDGATLQLGIGAIPDAVLGCLTERKDLGIHTEMFSDGVMHMMKKGNINGSKKMLHPNKVVTAFITGTKELYEFVDNNPEIELYPVDYTNDPFNIAQNDKTISINSCIEIDLLGQVNSESLGHKMFSGSGGQVDFIRGAKRSKGGKSMLAIPSTAKDDTISRITPMLGTGSVVTSGRNEVDYVVTEYGIAALRGKTAPEKALALIAIAHPKFRDELMEAAKKIYKGL